jgi:CheY-like chemotaxis protein
MEEWRSRMSPKHALIIDDNASNVAVLAEMLSLEGLSSTKIQDTVYLGDTLGTLEQVDVVFLDLEMPGLNGYAVYDHLREDPRFEDVPVVVCSVHVSEINNVRDRGFHSFIGKPLNADLFPEQLARILRGEGVWEASSAY